MSNTRARLYFAVFGASIVAAAACGARTGLDVPELQPTRADAGPDVQDAGPDVQDAGPDVPDVPDAPDVVDASIDVPVVVTDCEDAGIQYIYLITEQNELLAFYPPDQSIHFIGSIQCNDPQGTSPYSMAVDRKGIAYVVFQSGSLYRVSTLTASCKPTSYAGGFFGPNGNTFGMGFSADTGDPGETLYIASDDPVNGTPTPEFLGTIDVTTFQRSTVGQFPHVIGSAELTGTGDGRLYGFGVDNDQGALLSLVQIDTTNANVLSTQSLELPGGPQALRDWAFAFWGGDFYFFTSNEAQSSMGPNPSSTIYRLHTGQSSTVLDHVLDVPGFNIDGAGVSTCAPQE